MLSSPPSFEYYDWLAAECGYPAAEKWRNQMYSAATKNRMARPETYRDEWDDQHLVSQANEDFIKYSSSNTVQKEMDSSSLNNQSSSSTPTTQEL
ncbi:hypothetical protein CsSME_00044757 [Camellia sinensis var. sinensis]